MTHRFSAVISNTCAALLLLVPIAAFYYLFNLGSFAELIASSTRLPIQWSTVSTHQWYGMWVLTALYVCVGLVGLYFLRRAFANFAKGEFFNLAKSRDFRRFSILLLIQTLLTPLHFALSSVLLSLNHPAGQKMLSLAFGSNEIRAIGVALVMWVMSNLLVEGSRLQTENRQFV
ncbi:MAG: DUF2975 domain-containing protein [Granulosicoccaceae bacterium]